MKRIFITLTLFTLAVLVGTPIALAQNRNNIPAQIYYWGKKTNITNFPVGACKDNEGGLWQQLADGTWAPPEDPLNTCQTGGVTAGYTGNPLFDPWARQGIYPNQGIGTFANQAQYYPWGNNFPGGYSTTEEWFRNCVIMESLLPRPECQAFPRSGYFWPINQPWGSYAGEDGVYASYTDGPYGRSTHISGQGKLGNVLMGAIIGYGLNQLLK